MPKVDRDEPRHWFEDVADHLGSAYLRYSFTKGTRQEVAFLVEVLDLVPGQRILDVGCGPGRHAHALAALGYDVVGVDTSATFVDLAIEGAPPGARFERMDARSMPFDGEFDAAISLCQGAFGLCGSTVVDGDGVILDKMAAAVVPGARVAVSAFSSYFQVRYPGEDATFDALTGVNHERTTIKDPDGRSVPAELWTTCFTPRELRLMAERVGLSVLDIWSVTPGAYRRCVPEVDQPELLMVARRPGPATDSGDVAGSIG